MPNASTTARIALFALLFLTLATVVAAQSPVKIAVYDPQRVSEETSVGKQAQSRLEAARDAKQKEITDQEQIIGDLQQQLSQQSLSLSTEKRTTMEIDIQRRILELTAAKDLATRQLQLEIAAAEALFNDKLRVVIEQFGNDRGLSIILDRSTVAFAAPAVDVSTAIIDKFDQLFPAGSE